MRSWASARRPFASGAIGVRACPAACVARVPCAAPPKRCSGGVALMDEQHCATRAVCDSATRCASTERHGKKRNSPTTTNTLRAAALWREEAATRKLRHHRSEGGRPSTASSTDATSVRNVLHAFHVDVAFPLAHGQHRPRQPRQ
ncbi:uncharacterized protein ACA1_149340 [Acanthamoeba castellanii str. Neff]|uniref:Uncharacterized protein n=1 Tax=Acanthamoeba castellanii (strain ATCC 30010 / Neff) TaxID=1257118 RepID=L8HED2_ACACF|nr:uncharacterized protein ACA1_149340 [Acanthamoeba castellanii str. Neff]ELR22766.1 hypothetical protein ACA1_149340 [Acanthamoeba castellanii str. Neff]